MLTDLSNLKYLNQTRKTHRITIKSKNYLCFDIEDLGVQLGFSLEGFLSEVTQQLQFIGALAANDIGQLVLLTHLHTHGNS
jgi:hypothetical protein